ncbi:TauD/TfdA family dioxygenase [Vibrio diazotrophicus]|uniref:Alpha-ketoglutarate-dependent taurine dioxygenase n=1 Tax=Vibrio diazotrophicus TaxID=685 RepID=A0A329ELI1_VIBDI|nr:TauD/TfdA family dioxygenase [Vibrio diazotrophicus]RAS65290.1 alpha-ketoglutarate-dependent taurine dioxygenase [Vibrio diazotrophicus]
MNISSTNHSPESGLVIQANSETPLTEIDPGYILEMLADKGYVLFRGFPNSIEIFTDLVKSLSSSLSLDPARSFDGDAAQKVDAGTDKVGLHCENGNSPFWPDLCWFYCNVAPQRGSQTTVCDGQAVYKQMDDELKAAFQQEIKYSRKVDKTKWQRYALHASLARGKQVESIDDITIDDLKELVNDPNSSEIHLLDDGSIEYIFKTNPVRSSAVNKALTNNFANSIFGPSNHYASPVITYSNGNSIPSEQLDRMESLCERLTCNIDWEQGDILLIDNTRVMHGRRKIEDTERLIFNALSYI